MEFLISLWKTLLGSTLYKYKRQMQAEVQQRTTGRLQSKVTKFQHKVDDKVYGAQDKLLGKKKNKAPGKKK